MPKVWQIPGIPPRKKDSPPINADRTRVTPAHAETSPQNEPQPRTRRSTTQAQLTSDPFGEALKQQAWAGVISDGTLLSGYYAKRADAALTHTANEVRLGDLSGRLAALDAELEALIHRPPPPPAPLPTPQVLHSLSKIVQFSKGNAS